MASSLFGASPVPTNPNSTPISSNGGFQFPQNVQKLKYLMNMMNSSGSARQMVEGALLNNPKYRETINLINTQYNGDPMAAFYAEAKKKGADPNEIINLLR